MAGTKKDFKITTTCAKTNDGSIQIVFTIPKNVVLAAKKNALEVLAKETEIPGFRKGKAPLDKVEAKVGEATVIEKTLQGLLPKALANAINEFKLTPAIYPKFEAIKIKDGEDWQVKAVTCELPNVILGDYKKIITGASKAKTIWTPDKGDDGKDVKEPSREEKEQEIIKILLETTKITVPKMLIDEEVNVRLANLLERLEKLGLTLDSYLGSLGKTPESLRAEYELQAKNTIMLELILEKISEEEKIKVEETQIDEAIKAASLDPKLSEKLNSPEQRRLIGSVLRRRASLDSLVALM